MDSKVRYRALYVLLMVAMTGCASLLQPSAPTASVPTVVAYPTGTETAIAPATETPMPPATGTPIPPATETPTPVAASTATPTSSAVEGNGSVGGPVAIMRDRTAARTGPGTEYPPSHELRGQTHAPILGRDPDGSWWAVPGPGDGSGPVAWVADGDVQVVGDVSDLTVLWFVGHPYLPPADLCAVYHPGTRPGPLDVRLGPGEGYPVVALLGPERWAEVLESRNGWRQIRSEGGEVGWVNGSQVGLSGLCGTLKPTPVADVPLILDPGSPPSGVCVASLPAGVDPANVYLGPGTPYAVIARLGNWAEVLKRSGNWHMIWIVPGSVGWIQEARVTLSGPCPAAPGP